MVKMTIRLIIEVKPTCDHCRVGLVEELMMIRCVRIAINKKV